MSNSQSFKEKCYKDKHGKTTIAQLPNVPIIVWIASTLLTRIITNGSVHNILTVISFGALFTWAWMELFSGTNYFRRALGFVVLAILIYNRM